MANLKKQNKILYTRGGNGSTCAKLSIPGAWLEALGVSEENRTVELELKGKSIVIKAAKGE